MTTDQDILNEISSEDYDGDFSGDLEYQKKREYGPKIALPTYKVWNPNPQNPTGPLTPGIVMTLKEGTDKAAVRRTEGVIDTVRAVILFTSHGRELGRGNGANFKTVCQSHDGYTPSLRVQAPLCRKTTAEDVAQVFSQWRGYDAAKVTTQVDAVTQGSGKLTVCGLKARDGFIMLCPHANERKDPDTGQRGACKPFIFVHAYDIDRKREFTMKLTGKSIHNGKFIAPFHEFFKYLREGGGDSDGKPRGLPCYSFSVNLSVAPNGNYFYLDVNNWKPIAQADNRAEMKRRAEEARERYQRIAAWVEKRKENASQKELVNIAAKAPAKAEPEYFGPPVAQKLQPKQPVSEVSFEEDDIPF